jgi:hypothetical protein
MSAQLLHFKRRGPFSLVRCHPALSTLWSILRLLSSIRGRLTLAGLFNVQGNRRHQQRYKVGLSPNNYVRRHHLLLASFE